MTRHRLVRRVFAGTAVLAVLVMATPVLSQQPPSQEQLARDILALAWQRGPTEGRVGGLATIKVPEGQTFLDGPNTRRFLELNRNPPRERYSEFRSGDRVAQFGLGALVLGGAAAVAVKTGAGKALGKFLIYGAVAAGGTILAFLRKLFRRG